MKKKLLKNIFSVLVLVILIIAVVTIFKIDILPTKYLVYFMCGEALLYLLGVVLYNLKKKVFVILGIVLFIIGICANGVIYYYFGKTNKYLDMNFKFDTYEVKTTYVLLTGSSNSINNFDELDKNTNIEYYKYSRASELAIKTLGKFNYFPTDIGYDRLVRVPKDNIYFLISKSDYNFILEASNDLSDSDFRILKEFDVVEKVPVNNSTPDLYSIYINGLDYSGGRRDFNMIATINTKTHKIVLTSIPRDYYIYIPAHDRYDSLTALGTVDPEISKEALEKLFNTKIDYTLNLYTESLVKVVDTIGGVEFCSNSSFYTSHDLTLGSYSDKGKKLYVPKGCNTYNGLEALAIARERVHLAGGDRARQDNCRQILVNIFKSMASTTTLTNYGEILNSFDGLYTSNINKRLLTKLIKSVINNPNYEIIEQSVDGKDGKGIGHLGSGEVWTLTPNMDTVNAASSKINEVLNEK